jgi:hypothetical protein
VASDGVTFVECNRCWLGHAMLPHETMTPRQWAADKGWNTTEDGNDYCLRCSGAGVHPTERAPGPSVVSVAGSTGPSEADHVDAARLGLLGLTAVQNLDEIMGRLANLHPRNNMFPAEVLLELAAEAIGESGASPTESIQYEGIRDRYLPEYVFRGKSQQHKSHYALMAAAMIRAGVYPDLLDEAHGWGIEDMWEYAFYALVVYVRIAAERSDRTPEAVVTAISKRRGIKLDPSGNA